MKFSLLRLLLCAVCAMTASMAGAEKADSKKPMNIEADALRYDDLRQISVFTGNVVVTRGSIVIRGARMEVRQDAQGYQFGVVTAEPGKRAYFRQKRGEGDAGDEYIEGESVTLEYDGRTDVFKLITDAQLRRLRGTRVADTVSGNVIQYSNQADVFTVDGNPQKGGERVRATLTPRNEAAVPASRPGGATLRSDTSASGRTP